MQIGELASGGVSIQQPVEIQVESDKEPKPDDYQEQIPVYEQQLNHALDLLGQYPPMFSKHLTAYQLIGQISADSLRKIPLSKLNAVLDEMGKAFHSWHHWDGFNRLIYRKEIKACKNAYQQQHARLTVFKSWGNTPYFALACLVRLGEVEQVKRLWGNLDKPQGAQNALGENLMFEAVKSGSLDMVKLLIEKKVNQHALNQEGKSPFHEAIENKNISEKIGCYLIYNCGAYLFKEQPGCQVEAYELIKTHNRKTILEAAHDVLRMAKQVNDNINKNPVSSLLDAPRHLAYVHQNPHNGVHLLAKACLLKSNQRIRVIKYLIEHMSGCDSSTSVIENLFSIAVNEPDIELWKFLTSTFSKIPSIKGSFNGLLKEAMDNKNFELFPQLLELGANPTYLLGLQYEYFETQIASLMSLHVREKELERLLPLKKALLELLEHKNWKAIGRILKEDPASLLLTFPDGSNLAQEIFTKAPIDEKDLICQLCQHVVDFKTFFFLYANQHSHVKALLEKGASKDTLKSVFLKGVKQASPAQLSAYLALTLQEGKQEQIDRLLKHNCAWESVEMQAIMAELMKIGVINKSQLDIYKIRCDLIKINNQYCINKSHLKTPPQEVPSAHPEKNLRHLGQLCRTLFAKFPNDADFDVGEMEVLSVQQIIRRIDNQVILRIEENREDVALKDDARARREVYRKIENMLTHVVDALYQENPDVARGFLVHLAYVCVYCGTRLFQEVSSLYRSLCSSKQKIKYTNEDRFEMYQVLTQALLLERERIFNDVIYKSIGSAPDSHAYNHLLQTLGVSIGIHSKEDSIEEVIGHIERRNAAIDQRALRESFNMSYTPGRICSIVLGLIKDKKINPTEVAANYIPKAGPGEDQDAVREAYQAMLYDEDFNMTVEGIAYLLTRLGILKEQEATPSIQVVRKSA